MGSRELFDVVGVSEGPRWAPSLFGRACAQGTAREAGIDPDFTGSMRLFFYRRDQVWDLHSTLSTQPRIFSELPLIEAEPL